MLNLLSRVWGSENRMDCEAFRAWIDQAGVEPVVIPIRLFSGRRTSLGETGNCGWLQISAGLTPLISLRWKGYWA